MTTSVISNQNLLVDTNMEDSTIEFQNSKISNSKASATSTTLTTSNLKDLASYESNISDVLDASDASDSSSCFSELVREEASPVIHHSTELLNANKLLSYISIHTINSNTDSDNESIIPTSIGGPAKREED